MKIPNKTFFVWIHQFLKHTYSVTYKKTQKEIYAEHASLK